LRATTPATASDKPAPSEPASTASAKPKNATKLSYKEQRELDTLPGRIEALEQEQEQLHAELGDGSLYSRDPQRATTLHERDGTIEEELLAALTRWEELAARA
jgi:ATP-binding cassette subfamily F protein uup